MVWEVVAFVGMVIVGGAYEAYAFVTKKVPTITQSIKDHPHMAILVGSAIFGLFGYALGRGGP